MTDRSAYLPYPADPLAPLGERDGVLAVVTGMEGSAYRPIGAAMSFVDDDATGSVSSGCVEGALSAEAARVLEDGVPRTVRYGRGSPYIDVALPCGAGLDVTLWPSPDRQAMAGAAGRLRAREAHAVTLSWTERSARVTALTRTGAGAAGFTTARVPPLRLVVYGRGPETVAFARLAMGGGYGVAVHSSDEAVLSVLPDAHALTVPSRVPPVPADPQTAVVLFFHDHEWEPPILQSALCGPAFWVGAQGSSRAAAAREAALSEAGVPNDVIDGLHARIGLIPSARDPQTLAVSVLAEIVQAYKARWQDPYLAARPRLAAAS